MGIIGIVMEIRAARIDEASWVNERYAEVRFIPSALSKELVLVAEIASQPAGLGRLVPVDDNAAELGGMLVFDAFRGQGVARALINACVARFAVYPPRRREISGYTALKPAKGVTVTTGFVGTRLPV